jgi:acyl-CoA thioesterase YciA
LIQGSEACSIVARDIKMFSMTQAMMAMTNDAQTHHASADAPASPRGELSLRTLAMPADTNANGDIFGGWLLSQTVSVEAWVTRRNESHMIPVTDGTFTYVAIDDDGKPTPVKVTG